MSSHNIIDSNVIAISNGLHGDASLTCVQNANDFLKQIEEMVERSECFLIYDNSYKILNECKKHCNSANQTKLGTVFYKWVHQNIKKSKILLTDLPIDIETNDELLPPCFDGFDRNDRKYLFLALDFKEFNPSLHYGIDRGYQRYRQCFVEENIELSRLCD